MNKALRAALRKASEKNWKQLVTLLDELDGTQRAAAVKQCKDVLAYDWPVTKTVL